MTALVPVLLVLATAAPAPRGQEPRGREVGGFEQLRERVADAPARPRDAGYRVEDGVLVRRDPATGRGVALGCTLDGGPGRVVDLAAHPAGTRFVAAERGLFVVDDSVDHLDPLDLRTPLPRGPPVGVHVDARARLWVATRDGFGCWDAALLHGRAFGPADGLPAGPFRALLPQPDGSLVLRTDRADHRYRPDRGEGPRLAARRGGSALGAAEVATGGDGRLAFEAALDGRGGARLAWRPSHRFHWIPLEPAAAAGDPPAGGARRYELVLDEPGAHALELIAFDRDLRSSERIALRVRVPYPPRLDARWLALLVLAGAAAVTLAFLVRARRRGGGPARHARALLSSVALVAVALQVAAGLVPHGRSWPVVGFSMYTETYARGDATYKPTLYGTRPRGDRERIELFSAGYGLFEHKGALARLVHGTDAERQRYLDRLEEGFPGGGLTGFVILDERRRLTRHGPIDVAPTVLCVYEGER